MGLLSSITGGSGWSNGSGYGYNNGWSNANSAAQSQTFGTQASQYSDQQAAIANNTAFEYWKAAAAYNAQEAQKNREWQEYMSNTAYQRAVEDMKKAGINPILAASRGGASAGSGASASIGSSSSFMGTATPDSMSTSASISNSESSGENWNESQSAQRSGLVEGLSQMGSLIGAAISSLNASETLNNLMNKFFPEEEEEKAKQKAKTNGAKAAARTLNGTMSSLEKNLLEHTNKLMGVDEEYIKRMYTNYKSHSTSGGGHRF